MTYKIGLQTEFFENSDDNDNSAIVLASEAQQRGYELFHFTPDNISYYQGEVVAWVRTLKIKGNETFEFGEYERMSLKTLDIIIMRQERPYNLKYLTNSRLLQKIADETLIINNPYKTQTASDHWFVTTFPDIIPPTLISSNSKEIKAFRAEYKDVILKPLYSRHGEGKYHLTSESENIDSYLEMFACLYDQMIIAQKYIDHDNDRKIIIVDGEPIGAYDQPVTLKASIDPMFKIVPTKATMNERDYEICKHIAPTLKEMGVIIASVDIIGGYMIEIDINSPVGLKYIDKFDGINSAGYFWDAVEKRLK